MNLVTANPEKCPLKKPEDVTTGDCIQCLSQMCSEKGKEGKVSGGNFGIDVLKGAERLSNSESVFLHLQNGNIEKMAFSSVEAAERFFEGWLVPFAKEGNNQAFVFHCTGCKTQLRFAVLDEAIKTERVDQFLSCPVCGKKYVGYNNY